MKEVILIGAGCHSALIAEKILADNQFRLLGFIDKGVPDLPEFLTSKNLGVLGGDEDVHKYRDKYFHLALGGDLIKIRRKIINNFRKESLKTISVIDTSSNISNSVQLGNAVTALINTVIHTEAVIGDFCCINTGAIVEHGCRLGDNVFVQPGAVLAGNVTVGEDTIIGMGSLVRENTVIGKNCIIGGGSFVCKDIPDNSIAYGVPAKVVRKKTI